MDEMRDDWQRIAGTPRPFCAWQVGRLAFAYPHVKRNLGWKRLFWRFFWLDARFWKQPVDRDYVEREVRRFMNEMRGTVA